MTSSESVTTPGRIADLEDRVRSLLDDAVGALPPDGSEVDLRLARARERLEARMGAASPWRPGQLALACRLLAEIDVLQDELEQETARRRVAELHRVQSALDGLRDLPASEAVARAPEVLCRSCSFGRSMISSVIGSLWVPGRLHIEDGSDEHAIEFLAYVEDARIPLAHKLLETDLVRRRRPVLVHDAEADARTLKAMVRVARSSSYVAAPVMSRGRVVGFFHADRRDGDQAVTEPDRDRIAAFSTCFALVHEQSLLRSRLASQVARSRSAFAETEVLLERLERSRLELDDATLAVAQPGRPGTQAAHDEVATLPRVALALTAREREVMELMATGATNTQIAERLVIADGTVKSHVKHILRKLHVSTRSAAVARYARLAQRSEMTA